MCLEKRAFYRIVSGLHSSISIHLCANYPTKQVFNSEKIHLNRPHLQVCFFKILPIQKPKKLKSKINFFPAHQAARLLRAAAHLGAEPQRVHQEVPRRAGTEGQCESCSQIEICTEQFRVRNFSLILHIHPIQKDVRAKGGEGSPPGWSKSKMREVA